MATLNAMANPLQDPDAPDPSAGLYSAPENGGINPDEPGPKISGAYAYNRLRDGQAVSFHPPDGAYERLNDLGDLNAYLYAQQDAPPPGAVMLNS